MLLELALIIIFAITLAVPLSKYVNFVLTGGMNYKYQAVRTFEKYLFQSCTVELHQQNWKSYLSAVLSISLISFVFGTICLILQNYLPLNPQNLDGVPWSLALNISTSYVTATNWQAYAGETTLSYFSQCVLTMLAFISTGVGISTAIAMVRGITNQNQELEGYVFGNFWIDFLRTIIFILLPLCITASLIFISQGVIQNFAEYTKIHTLDNMMQTIAQGPVAAQESIKLIGVNGGGFFGVNSAHPYENPTGFSNFFQMLLMLLIPCSLALIYADMVNKKMHGWVIILFMTTLLVLSAYTIVQSEMAHEVMAVNIEGKETRFGIQSSALYMAFCSVTSGSANSALMSYNPESVIYILTSMLFGGAIFGGAGAGLLNLLLFVLMAVFLAGMMAGRAPKFLGKTIEFPEIKFITIFLVVYQCLIVSMLSLAILNTNLTDSINSKESLAITQLAISYASTMVNNGLGFGSFDTNNIFLNLTLALNMIVGRLTLVYCMFRVADSLSNKRSIENRLEEVQTENWFFAFLIFFAMLNDFLVFVPTIIIGPVIEFLITR
jgi:K+-transporting ATPase ATPase A chain